MKTPYEELGVDVGADTGAIRAAYLKRVKATHPDREGGCREEFQRVQRAWETLSDPKRRAEYDKTGRMGDEARLAPSGEEQVAQLFMAWIVDDQRPRGEDPVAWMRDQLWHGMQDTERTIDKVRKELRGLAQLGMKLRRREGTEGILESVLMTAIEPLQRELKKAEAWLSSLREGRGVLERYSFGESQGAMLDLLGGLSGRMEREEPAPGPRKTTRKKGRAA